MTIASVILGLSPYLYWPLDDPTGPAASDASGNGRPGAYNGNFGLLQPGPEAGTYSAVLRGGFVAKAAPSYIASGQTATLMVWAALGVVPNGTSSLVANSSGTTGGSLTTISGGGSLGTIGITRNNIAATNLNYLILDYNWHHYAVVFTGTGVTAYVDGSAIGSVGAANAFSSASSLGTGSQSGLFAHLAAWNSALSAGNIASVFTAPASLQIPPFASVGVFTGDVSTQLGTISADLSTIIQYIAKTYQNSP